MASHSDEKKKRLESMLERGVTMIHLDARFPGVLVPPKFREEYDLSLNLSYRYEPFDLAVSDWGVRQTLTFGGMPQAVAVPWQAIFALTSSIGEGQVWLFPESLPPEMLEAVAARSGLTPEDIQELRHVAHESPSLSVKPEDVRAAADAIHRQAFKPRVVVESEDAAAEPAPVPEVSPSPGPSGDGAVLRSTDDAAAGHDDGDGGGPPELPPSGPRRGHLRVVK